MMRLLDLFETSPTDNPAFRKWFAGSKVVDEFGQPLMMMHGTDTDFDYFYPFSHFGDAETANARLDSTRPGYGNMTYPVYLSIKNPLRLKDYGEWNFPEVWHERVADGSLTQEQVDAIQAEVDQYAMHGRPLWDYDALGLVTAELSKNGYDGIVYKNRYEFTGTDSWIIFDSNQAKSAFNKGTYSRSEKMSESAIDNPAFRKWFGNSVVKDGGGDPMVVYHGTTSDIGTFRGMVWGSVNPSLAHDYTRIREFGTANSNLMPLYMRIERPFDSIRLPDPTTIEDWGSEVLDQANKLWNVPHSTTVLVSNLIDKLIECGKREESGPHYNRHDFWYSTRNNFGHTGFEYIHTIYELLMFDGIIDVEYNIMTYGVFKPTQVKSAYNRGTWDSDSSHISEGAVDDPRLQRGLRIPPNAKLWRGTSSEIGSGMAVLGQGLYMTTSRSIAKQYGTVREVNRMELPDNPVRFNSFNDWQIWIGQAQKEKGLAGNRDMGEHYHDVSQFIHEFVPDADGVQIGSGGDAVIVAWPRLNESTNNDAFRKWFKNSKIVNPDGSPMRVYHGTGNPNWTQKRTKFDPNHSMGTGIYFTPHPGIASEYANMDAQWDNDDPFVIPVYLSIQNPRIVRDWSEMDYQLITPEEQQALIKQGHDGVMGYHNEELNEIVAFYPNQIKSVFNRGTYGDTEHIGETTMNEIS